MPDEEKRTRRNSVVEALLEEADRMEPHLFQPNSPVEAGDKVIGQVTDEYMKRLFSAGTLYLRDVDQLVAEHRYSPAEERSKAGARMQELSKKGDLFMSIFWFCVRAELKAWDLEIGIRTGWRVVKCVENPIRDLLRKLGGE